MEEWINKEKLADKQRRDLNRKTLVNKKMRKRWGEHVNKVYEKLKRKAKRDKTTITRREAMKVASESWPKEKAKILRKMKKEEKAKDNVKLKLNEGKM